MRRSWRRRVLGILVVEHGPRMSFLPQRVVQVGAEFSVMEEISVGLSVSNPVARRWGWKPVKETRKQVECVIELVEYYFVAGALLVETCPLLTNDLHPFPEGRVALRFLPRKHGLLLRGFGIVHRVDSASAELVFFAFRRMSCRRHLRRLIFHLEFGEEVHPVDRFDRVW